MPGDPRLRRAGGKRPQLSDRLGQRWVHGKKLVQRNKKAAFALMLVGKRLGRDSAVIPRACREQQHSSHRPFFVSGRIGSVSVRSLFACPPVGVSNQGQQQPRKQ